MIIGFIKFFSIKCLYISLVVEQITGNNSIFWLCAGVTNPTSRIQEMIRVLNIRMTFGYKQKLNLLFADSHHVSY